MGAGVLAQQQPKKASYLGVGIGFEKDSDEFIATKIALDDLDPGDYTLKIDKDGNASLEKVGWLGWLLS